MKPKFRSLIAAFAPLSRSSLIVVASLCAATSVHAASATWSATAANATWNDLNWSAAFPNAAADSATFNAVSTFGDSLNPVTLTAGVGIQNMNFAATAGPYVVGVNGSFIIFPRGSGAGGTPSFFNSINIAAAVTNSQVVAAPISFSAPSSTTIGYTLRNDSTTPAATLTLSGLITTNTASNRHTSVSLDGTHTGTNTVSGVISATGNTQGNLVIQKTGLGTWILAGANILTSNSMTNTGGLQGIQVNAGVLSVQHTQGLGTNATANNLQTWINAGATLELANNITLDNGVSLNLRNGGTVRSAGSITTNGRINLSTAALTNATLSTVGAADVFTIGNAANDLSGGASDTVINTSGPGTILQNFASNYVGGWSINAGTLKLGSATALGLTSAPVAFGASSTGILQLNGNSVTIGSLASNATVGTPVVENGTAGTATATVGGTAVTTYGGLLRDGAAGILALTKSGSGTLNLTAANTYSGGTTVSGGLLKVNNLTGSSATGTTAVTIAAGGTLGGSGFISGAVTVNSTGTIAPGNSVGTLTVSSLALDAGSKLNYEFNTTPANDFVNVTAAAGLTINGGGFTLYNEGTLDAFSTNGTNYNLVGHSGAIGGTGVSSLSVLNPQPGKSYTFSDTGSMVKLAIAASGVVSDWSANANGSWSAGGSWTGAVPNGVGQTGNFNFPLTAVRTVTLDGSKTLGGISFNGGASPVGYIIAPGTGGTLSINNGVSQANIIVTSGANTISADVSLDSTNTVAAVATGSSLTISGSVGGIGSLVKSGLGLLDLTHTVNAYAGNTTLSGGTLGFAALGSLGGGNLTIDAGTLRYNTGNTADISSKLVTLLIGGAVIDTNGNDVTYANAIGNAGSGNFTKSGAGVLTMNGNNDFTGTTTVTGGSLVLTGTSATTGGTTLSGANTLLGINSDAALGAVPGAALTNLTLNPGVGNIATLRSDATFTLNFNRNISTPSGTAVIDSNGNFLTINGLINGAALIHKISAGGLTLTGVNSATASGGIMIDAGTVFTNTQANLPAGIITLNGTGGISNGTPAANFSNVVINGINSILKTGTNNIIGLGNISGNGSLTFGSGYVNDFTGTMTAFTGTLIVAGGGNRFNGTTGGTNVTLDLAGFGATVRNTATGITLGALTGTATANLSGSGGGALQAVTYTIGGKTVDGLGITPVDSNFSGAITNGAGKTNITKVGLSTLTLSGLSTYNGNTSVQGGALVLADNAGLTFRPGASGVTNSITGTGSPTLTLDGDFSLDLTDPAALVNGASWTLVNVANFAANPFSASFTVIGFTEAANVWTKVDAGKTWTFSESTGVLSLVIAGYSGWAATNAGGQTADLDFDNDGTTNGLEYFMNAAAGFTASQALNGSNTITWPNGGNIAPGAYGTEFVVQTSNDLATWVDVLVGGLASNTASEVSYTLTGTAPRFVRLKVSPN